MYEAITKSSRKGKNSDDSDLEVTLLMNIIIDHSSLLLLHEIIVASNSLVLSIRSFSSKVALP